MSSPQNYEKRNAAIRDQFLRLKKDRPQALERSLQLSWSNWGFGRESLIDSLKRLQRARIDWIELHGNHYGPDVGYRVEETRRQLDDHGIRVAGICGMFSAENDLSAPSGTIRQAALDYLRRELDFASAMDAGYILVVPGAVGRPSAYDDMEFDRSVDTLRLLADEFGRRRVRAAIEPIRAAEVSFCHTVADAQTYIAAVDHPAIQHINGDVYHMQSEETHIGEAVVAAGERLVNLHLADSNRRAIGEGSLDVDTLIMALYVAGANRPECFVTPEPLGSGGDPYPAMHGRPDTDLLDRMVMTTASVWRERERIVRNL